MRKLKKVKREVIEAEMPSEYQRPESFRQMMEQKSDRIPQKMNIPVLPAYIVLITAICYWCYYGYQYNKVHGTGSLAEIIIFFSAFLLLFIILVVLWANTKQVKMCSYLKRIAETRQGAFLFISGKAPTLFYAKEGWTGKLVFWLGGDSTAGTTSLEAITMRSGGWLSISKKTLSSAIFSRSDKDNIPLPESDFSREFTMSGTDVLAEELLNAGFSGLIMRLEGFKKPSVEIDGKSVTVEITENLYSMRKEAKLREFLDVAESIVDTVVQQG